MAQSSADFDVNDDYELPDEIFQKTGIRRAIELWQAQLHDPDLLLRGPEQAWGDGWRHSWRDHEEWRRDHEEWMEWWRDACTQTYEAKPTFFIKIIPDNMNSTITLEDNGNDDHEDWWRDACTQTDEAEPNVLIKVIPDKGYEFHYHY